MKFVFVVGGESA